jgi:hypothetical protein
LRLLGKKKYIVRKMIRVEREDSNVGFGNRKLPLFFVVERVVKKF